MRKTRFRNGGMTVCMFLAVMSGMPVTLFTTPSYAQTQTTTPGSSVATGLASGQSPAQIAAGLAGQGGANAQQWTTILNSLQSGGATTAAITSVVNILAGGTMNPTQAASAIAAAIPSLATALGGASGILGALGSAGGLAAGLAGAISGGTGGTGGTGTGTGGSGPGSQGNGGNGGGQQVMSQQNPVNNSHTDAGCNCQSCNTHIPNHYSAVRSHTQAEFQRHRSWIVNTFWLENMLPALQRMAAQLTAVGIAQIQMIGAMLDAKHQLETQRIFQQMMAQAHKDYQPSEGMCTFGTTVRSLAGSERRSNIAQMAFSQRMNQRQTLSGDVLSREGLDSDKRSRLQHFIANYCDQADNANGLNRLCRTAVTNPARRNIDVDYTRNIESRLTLDVAFIPATPPTGLSPTERDEFNAAQAAAPATQDEQDVFALSANLFANQIASAAAPENLAVRDGRIRLSNVEKYMDLRSIFAKRSVAQNSFAAIVAQRAAGAPESAPYTKAVLRELGIRSDTEINQLLGENPSYFAQMEVLTKKLYQNPSFYTELYDKPVNVERKAAAMQAIGLMQDRDLYNSLLRSEVVLSVLLETMLQKEQDKVVNEGPKRNPAAGAR